MCSIVIVPFLAAGTSASATSHCLHHRLPMPINNLQDTGFTLLRQKEAHIVALKREIALHKGKA